MPLFGEYSGAEAVPIGDVLGVFQLSRSIQQLVGTTSRVILRPADERILTVRCESGTIRIRPGAYDNEVQMFTPNNIVPAGDTISILNTPNHTFETGDGPVQITAQAPSMAALTSVVIDAATNSFTRTVGNWRDDGFWFTGSGQTFTLTGSSDNDGTFTVNTITGGTVMVVDEDITMSEVAQTDLVITGALVLVSGADLLTNFWIIDNDSSTIKLASSLANALAGTAVDIDRDNAQGLFNIGGPAGWAANAVAAASKTDGYGSVALVAGEQISFPAPARTTLVGMSASDACSYWFGK